MKITNTIKLFIVTIFITITFSGCFGSKSNVSKVTLLPKQNVMKVNSKHLTNEEAKFITKIIFHKNVNYDVYKEVGFYKENRCISTEGGMRSRKLGSYTAYYKECYKYENGTILRTREGANHPNIFKFYPERAKEVISRAKKLDSEIVSEFNKYAKDYLKNKSTIKKLLPKINKARINFNLYSNEVQSKVLLKKLSKLAQINEKKDYTLKESYEKGRKYYKTPFDYYYSEGIKFTVKYNNPVHVYYNFALYNKYSKEISLKEYIFKKLPLYIASSNNIDFKYNEKLKFQVLFDKKSKKTLPNSNYLQTILSYDDLKNNVIAEARFINVNKMPIVSKISNNDLNVKYFNTRERNQIEFQNNKSSFIHIKTTSIYHGEKITTLDVNKKLPPKSIVKYSFDNRNIRDNFDNIKGNEDYKFKTGLAVEYTNLKTNENHSIFNLTDSTLKDILK